MYKISLNNYINIEELNSILCMQKNTIKYFNERVLYTVEWNFWIWNSTYRVFWWLKFKPSEIFKDWAKKIIDDKDFIYRFSECKSKEDFYILHIELWNRLNFFWEKMQWQNLLIAHKNKLIDLFLKYLVKIDFWNNKINEALLKYANIPIDSKTLPVVNSLFNWIFLWNKFSMWDIKTIESYNYIQELVSMVMYKNNSFPLNLDYYANNKI